MTSCTSGVEFLTSCPIVESAIEITCSYTVPSEVIIGVLYNALNDGSDKIMLEALPICNIPEDIRQQDPNLRNKPTHRLRFENFFVVFGPSYLSIGHLPPYSSWIEYCKHVEIVISVLKDYIKEIQTLSLKYLNFFELNIFENIKLNISFDGNPLRDASSIFKTEFENENSISALQITGSVHIQNTGIGLDAHGSLIDIKIIKNETITCDNIIESLNDCHKEAKELFFKLLNEEFVESKQIRK